MFLASFRNLVMTLRKPQDSCNPANVLARTPARLIFAISAFFHYLGPAFAVILFSSVPVLGVTWIRIASAAAIYSVWRRPWHVFKSLPRNELILLIILGGIFASMNSVFYIAISKIPLATVGAIEFLAPVGLAMMGVRNIRNLGAFGTAITGAYLLSAIQLPQQPMALIFAFVNCILFGCYIVLGHRLAQSGSSTGIDRIGSSMLFATVFITPIGSSAAPISFLNPILLGEGIGVGVCSSVIPYALDQVTMSRLPRASFALLLSILPATATAIGVIVLRQVPNIQQLGGIALIAAGVALHQPDRV